MVLIVRHEKKVQSVDHPAGRVRAITTSEDFEGANLAVVYLLAPDLPHYHRRSTEFYFVAQGHGTLVVGNEVTRVRPGSLVVIPPRTAHYLIPRPGAIKLLVFSIPAWRAEDECVIDPDKPEAGYSLAQEKSELVNELLRRAGLELAKSTSGEQRKKGNVARMALVSREGWNELNVGELRELLSRKK